MLDYCRELDVPVEVFVNEAEGAYFFYEGEAAGPLANKRVRLREVKADMIGHTNELIVKAIDQKQLDLPLTAEDKERFVRYLVAQGYLDGQSRTYRAFTARGEGNPHEIERAAARSPSPAACDRFRRSQGTTTGTMFQPVGGMDQIPKGFQRAIEAGRLTLNAEVQSVHQNETGVNIVYLDTRERHAGREARVPTSSSCACRCRSWPASTSTSRPS